jgi:hypothetical protein
MSWYPMSEYKVIIISWHNIFKYGVLYFTDHVKCALKIINIMYQEGYDSKSRIYRDLES